MVTVKLYLRPLSKQRGDVCGYTIVSEKCQLLQAEEEATHLCQAAVGCPGTCYQRALIKEVFYANFQIPRITSLTSSRGQASPLQQSGFNHLLFGRLYPGPK